MSRETASERMDAGRAILRKDERARQHIANDEGVILRAVENESAQALLLEGGIRQERDRLRIPVGNINDGWLGPGGGAAEPDDADE